MRKIIFISILFFGQIALAGFTMDENSNEERGRKWPRGIIPYKISSEFGPGQVARIKKVAADYNARTVIKWVEWSGQKDYVEFVVTGGNAAGSGIGMLKGRQIIMIRITENADVVSHEMGHTIGLHHEETRPDIADHLKFVGNMNNERDALCYELYFQKTNARGSMKYSSYDHYSVMRRNGFCTIGGPAVVLPKVQPPALPDGWNWDEKFFSPTDAATINALYLDNNRNWPDPEAGTCHDKIDPGFCHDFMNRGDCESYSMQLVAFEMCAKTCDLCKFKGDDYLPPEGSYPSPTPTPTVTVTPTPSPTPGECSNTQPKDFCDLGSTMNSCATNSRFAGDCKWSCGSCSGSRRVTVMADANGKTDNPWCGGWVLYDNCSMPFVASECPASCRALSANRSLVDDYRLLANSPPTPPPPPACDNAKDKDFCDLGSTMNLCATSMKFGTDCKLSCGSCPGSDRVTVMVDSNGRKDNPWCGGWVRYDQCSVPFVLSECPMSCRVQAKYRTLFNDYK